LVIELCFQKELLKDINKYITVKKSVEVDRVLKYMCTTLYSWHILWLLGPGWLSWYSDSLWAGQSVDPLLVVAIYSAPIQTWPGAHSTSCIMGTRSSLGVKWPGWGVDHPPTSSAVVKGRVELYHYFTSGPSGPVPG
jgi:hypothetical protein